MGYKFRYMYNCKQNNLFFQVCMFHCYQPRDRRKRGNNDSALQGPPKIQDMAIFVLFDPSVVFLLCVSHYDSALGSHSY